VDCNAFAKAPADTTPAPRGRPRKTAPTEQGEAPPAEPTKKGKGKKGK
jgi:hypothetical protein